MKASDEVVVLYAIVPKEKYGRVLLPDGSFAKAWTTGRLEELLDSKYCRGWGAMMAEGLNRVARKLCPELAESKIIQLNKGPQL